MIKAVIFDFDGLIFDTETFVLQAFEEMYDEYQVNFPKEAWNQSIGTSLAFDPYEALLLRQPTASKEELKAEYERRYQSIREGKLPREGVIEYLQRAKQLNLKIAIASSSPRSWIDEHVSILAISQYFDFICTADDVEQIKPDPELYQKVLHYFDIQPHEAIVFEDSPNGSLAAIRAGIPCVIVPNETTRLLVFDERITLRINSKRDMTLDEVIEKISALR
ncbi:HAD family hydrolase [Brevibacillus sp. B_LB10_24]|uniref:HAD family hydrolase n=1 Tax=Brevibacillus sp. B_LB10_24 TaxID=3380645 RepID=UPI0038BA43FB